MFYTVYDRFLLIYIKRGLLPCVRLSRSRSAVKVTSVSRFPRWAGLGVAWNHLSEACQASISQACELLPVQ